MTKISRMSHSRSTASEAESAETAERMTPELLMLIGVRGSQTLCIRLSEIAAWEQNIDDPQHRVSPGFGVTFYLQCGSTVQFPWLDRHYFHRLMVDLHGAEAFAEQFFENHTSIGGKCFVRLSSVAGWGVLGQERILYLRGGHEIGMYVDRDVLTAAMSSSVPMVVQQTSPTSAPLEAATLPPTRARDEGIGARLLRLGVR